MNMDGREKQCRAPEYRVLSLVCHTRIDRISVLGRFGFFSLPLVILWTIGVRIAPLLGANDNCSGIHANLMSIIRFIVASMVCSCARA